MKKENTNDILAKIKNIKYLTNKEFINIEQIANYYEVTKNAIETIIKRHREEIEEFGIDVLKGEKLKNFKNEIYSVYGKIQI